MSDLVQAIESEAGGDFATALEHYANLTESGSALDRVGIFQALARCNEKLGRLREAGAWRRKAGQGYLALSDGEMAKDERQYLALVEYRNAVQNLHGDPSLAGVAKEYADVLKANFSGGAEGLTHEGLFAGAFFRALGDHLTAAKYFFDTAEAMSEQASATGDVGLRAATILTYERAMESATKGGRPDVARVAQMRAYDLKQGT
jgi:tetratricopeptide (TPR) repeat protein